MNNSHNNRGTSILFVLAALIVTGFVGVAMIKMVAGDRMSAALYSTSASARSAAKSGIISGINYLETRDSATIIGILSDWIDQPTNPPQWLNVGNSTEFLDLTSNTIVAANANTNPKCQTQMIAFDENNFTVTLMAQGIGKGGARATVTSVYRLDGLEYEFDKGNRPANAIQMDNGNFEFDCEFIVNGNTSAKKNMKMNNGPAEFHGTFRIDTLTKADGSKEISTLSLGIEVTIDSTAYFAGNFNNDGSGEITFMQNVGFDGLVKLGNNNKLNYTSGYTAFFNKGLHGDDEDQIDMDGATLYAYGIDTDYKSDNAAKYKGINLFYDYAGPTSLRAIPADLPTDLGLPVEPDPKIYFNKDILGGFRNEVISTAQYGSNRLTAAKMNTKYLAAQAAGNLWNDYYVLEIAPGNTSGLWYPFKRDTDGTQFQGKAIILMTDPSAELLYFYETDTTTATDAANIIYFEKYPTNSEIFSAISTFRGFVYCNKTNSTYLGITGNDLAIKGSVYFSEKANSFFNGSKTTISYDSVLVKELYNMGIFSDPSNMNKELKLKTTHGNVIAHLVSQSI